MQMTVFLDDFIYSLQSVGGISVYWTSVLNEINKIAHGNIILVRITDSNNILVTDLKWNKRIIPETNLPFSLSRILPFCKKLPAKSLFHSSYLRVSLQKDVCNIVTIHDLAAELDKIKGIRRWLKLALQRFAIKHADGIICVSETTKKSLMKYYPKLDESNVKIIHHGCSDAFYPYPDKNGSEKLTLFIGGRGEYKNFKVCVKALSQFPTYKLLMIGGGKLSKKEQIFLKQELGERFSHTENVPTEKLNSYYNKAFCLLYPSFYEGFGMPVLEAMKAGCPVISTNIEAINEVTADSAILVKDFWDTEAYVQAIHFLENGLERDKLIKKGIERAKLFSWKKHCEEQLSFYQYVYYKKFKGQLVFKEDNNNLISSC